MQLIRTTIILALAVTLAHAQSSYLIDKNTGERFGPFAFTPNSEVKIGDTVFKVSPAQESQHFKSPEEALRAYLEAEYWQDRIPLVVDGDQVSGAMRERYQNIRHPVRTRYYKIRPNPKPLSGDEGAILYLVNRNGSDVEYVVQKTTQGYKVDWTASLRLWQKSETADQQQAHAATVERFSLQNPVLHVRVERLAQSSTSYAKLHIRVLNSSKAFLGYWAITATVFDRNGQFLAHAYTNGRNLKPGADVFDDISFANIQAHQITKWTLKIKGITVQNPAGETLHDAEKYFTLTEDRKRGRTTP
jgi:hypothetical protein